MICGCPIIPDSRAVGWETAESTTTQGQSTFDSATKRCGVMNEGMALFTRRAIQVCLDENAEFVSTDNLRNWVQRLNRVSDDYVATEWEVVLLRAFARFGRVLHEPPLGRRPIDLNFKSSDGELQFVADIAAISDQPLHDKNPIDRFRDELAKRIEKAKIDTGRFVFHVEEDQPIAHRGTGRKRRLSLPLVGQFATYIFNAAFHEYIEMIRKEPGDRRDHYVHHHSPAVAVTIQYQPGTGRGVGTASYGSYTSTTVKDDNPLFNALKSKATQLKQSGYKGIRGIIVCDRGSRVFTEMSNWATFNMTEVIKDFFRQHSSISFVVTMGIKSTPLTLGASVPHEFEPKLFVRPADAPKDWVSHLDRLVFQVICSLPKICQTPENAIRSLKWHRSTLRTTPYLGGWILEGNKIRISARELLDLLAGKLDQKRFAENHDTGGGNIFTVYRAHGKMIKRADVEPRPEEDDDWVILEFSADDQAVSKFRLPKSEESAQREQG